MHSRKSLLFNNTDIWIKKYGDLDFDVTMGSFDGAELCELVGLYILHSLGEKYGKHGIGYYRDDELACFGYTSGPQADRTQPSLHPNCHHQIIYAKFNFEVFYPPPYTREVWHYKDSNVDLIRRSINEFDWDRAFANKHVDEKVLIFNKTVLNILSNFIPHEVIVCDDKDPPWFNGKINTKVKHY